MAISQTSIQLSKLLKHLPAARYAFAYGSGVMVQPGLYETSHSNEQVPSATAILPHAVPEQTSTQSSKPRPMVDFILAVEDPVAWHRQNINSNPEHYSWVSKLGPSLIHGIATHIGVGVHFNTMVPLGNQLVKYGVMSYNDLADDLTTWHRLYVAGRLHKPVCVLTEDHNIATAQEQNKCYAALTALLLLPQKFTTQEFLQQLVGLSYHGDVRMGLAEDPHKVSRIVAGSYSALLQMYKPLLEATNNASHTGDRPQHAAQTAASYNRQSQAVDTSPNSQLNLTVHPGRLAGLHTNEHDHQWQQDISYDTRLHMLAHLPPVLLQRVGIQIGYNVPEGHCMAGTSTALDVAHAAMKTKHHEQLVRTALASTVRQSSMWQALAGLVAAGGGKAAAYVAAKLTKAYNTGIAFINLQNAG